MVSTLTRIFGLKHIDLVEDAVQDALVRALRLWPYEGSPDNPSAWLIQVAKNRVLDRLRRHSRWHERYEETARSIRALPESAAESEPAFAREVRDDQLRMIFTCCHPAIPSDSQIALTLKTVGGFSTAEIARAFLAREATVAQRLVRAKRKLKQHAVGLEMPAPEALGERLDPVLGVLYLMFNEGYSALEGDALVRSDLCHEAIRLVELLAQHPVTASPRVHALAALFFFQGARLATRADAAGDLMLLVEQDRSLWDAAMLRRGLAHLERSASGNRVSIYHLQAEIASCHALAPSFESTDWSRILSCYDDLLALDPSPVVALNRTVALALVEGPKAGLLALDELERYPALRNYYPYYATRGELMRQLGRDREALSYYRKALSFPCSEPAQRFLQKRIDMHTASAG